MSDAPTQGFLSWVSDPARTNDELFTVELVLEGLRYRQDWPFHYVAKDFQSRMDRMEARRANPAYRPALHGDELAELARRAPEVKMFSANGRSDRSLRDLRALAFFPALTNVNISSIDLADLTPLAALPDLEWLTMMEGNLPFSSCSPFDFAQCGAKPKLERSFLSLHHSWPKLQALSGWPLKHLQFHGNVLALTELKALPFLEDLGINGWADRNAQLRDLKVFPEMPKLKRMTLYSAASLEGIERYPSLVNLEIGGSYTDLEPLVRLPNLTALTISSERVVDLSPVARMTKLREIKFIRECPLDLSALTDAAQLRRVEFEHCAIMRTETAAVSAGLLPEAEDFLAEVPRALPPLKFYLISKENEAAKKFFLDKTVQCSTVREEFYAGDAAFEQAESRSFACTLQRELDGLLGRGWGLLDLKGWSKPGRMQIGFKRFADTSRIREIVALLRKVSAAARFPWVFSVMVEPHGDMTYELEQIRKFDEEMKAADEHWLAYILEPEYAEKENAEQAQWYKESYDILTRQHLYKLQEQQGGAIEPELFAPAPEPEAEPPVAQEEEPLSEPDDESDERGGVAIAPPPPAPPDTPDLSAQLRYAIDVYEDCMTVGTGWHEKARYGLGEVAVDWTPECSGAAA